MEADDRPGTSGNYTVESFEVHGLWGQETSVNVPLGSDVNIIIGPNASGKTTLINLLRCVLQVDVPGLLDVIFSSATVILRGAGKSRRTITVSMDERFVTYRISRRVHSIPVDPYAFENNVPRSIRARITGRQELVKKDMDFVAGLVWLPVSRRLPVAEEIVEERPFARRSIVESVDHRLGDLLVQLAKYRSNLEVEMAKEYKTFERNVLSIFLYDKAHDRWNITRAKEALPKEEDKHQLVRAFEVANLLTSAMRKKIDEHFKESEAAFRRITSRSEGEGVKANDAFFMPLVSRTKAMIELARGLEERRHSIFGPLNRFLDVVNSFLSNKVMKVVSGGKMEVSSKSSGDPIKFENLSSGEKQILILLIQALLKMDKPCIYIADEPELSLHVIWQERLIPSIRALAEKAQIIVATHSPDIVGEYRDRIFDMSGT